MANHNIFLKTVLAATLMALPALSHAKHWVGGDISLLPDYEKAGAAYRQHDGKPIDQALPFFKQEGMNAMRVRLFVNPSAYTGSDKDPNACQSLEYIIPLCKEIRDAGLALMLDFHYSDTWADPEKQYTPAAWANLSDDQLYDKIYDYTRETLLTLREHGIVPEFIQTGNEISYGMLWGPEGTPESAKKKCYTNSAANWERFGALLRQAIKACGEVCPDARIVIHTERVAQPAVLKAFYQKMERLQVDYDIIGLSYYPYFHGNMSVLDTALGTLESSFPGKEIMIVETGYPYKWEVPGTTEKVDYPYTDAGQDSFAKALVSTLETHSQVDGLFWWWMEYNAYGTSLTGWYNAPLFDSTTGMATSALSTICTFAKDSGIDSVGADGDDIPQVWYDLAGRPVTNPAFRGLYISRGRKILR